MNRLLSSVVLMACVTAAWAGDKTKPQADKKPAAAKTDDKKTEDKLVGEVVDITCFASHEGKGEKHASCAQKCLSAGMPAGIYADGKLYVATMMDHTAPTAKLAPLGGKMVTAMGHKIEKDGTLVFEIDTVEPAK